MKQTTIDVSSVSNTLFGILDDYSAMAIKQMKDATQKAAVFGANEVKKDARKIKVGTGDHTHTGLKKTGKYIKSWTYKKTNETSMSVEYHIYSKKYYMLTHLLEYGHEKVLFGKRMAGERVRGYPHISKAQITTENEFANYVITGLEKYDSF